LGYCSFVCVLVFETNNNNQAIHCTSML
jgi:hypothetical protein